MNTQPLAVKRLKKRREFLFVAKGKKAVRSSVVIQARRRDGSSRLEPHIGIGFTATRKVGGAVVRNRCKRRLRETARLLVPLHGQSGFDYVFIARAATAEKEWSRLMGDVKSALVSLAEDGAPGNDAKQA
ncbi:ribonuclease P protein component [Maricaulis sp.]|uniref:ribonuclease P protein component n=1 Tax=Maricaulis sp. TaxID=1486257 RepID=UPI0026033428|nr:ribonuclease P protein component [Maricaulis sp.]